jgi:hypothetical protein
MVVHGSASVGRHQRSRPQSPSPRLSSLPQAARCRHQRSRPQSPPPQLSSLSQTARPQSQSPLISSLLTPNRRPRISNTSAVTQPRGQPSWSRSWAPPERPTRTPRCASWPTSAACSRGRAASASATVRVATARNGPCASAQRRSASRPAWSVTGDSRPRPWWRVGLGERRPLRGRSRCTVSQ